MQPNAQLSAFLFDLDGTLLDTLPDLVALANAVLERHGCPPRTRDQILSYVGDGARVLLRRAFPGGTDDTTIEEAYGEFMRLYDSIGMDRTTSYPHIPTVLKSLRAAGIATGVLSNKYDAGVNDVLTRFLPGLVDVAHGEREDQGIPRKPDPAGLVLLAQELHVHPSACAYFGDSGTDIIAAKQAGMKAIGCSWGYRSRTELWESGADLVIDRPQQILELLEKPHANATRQ